MGDFAPGHRGLGRPGSNALLRLTFMVRYLDEGDYYKRGCNDGTSLILALVTLCSCVALIITNYLASWPIYMPLLELAVAVLNMAAFSSNPRIRHKNMLAIGVFLALH